MPTRRGRDARGSYYAYGEGGKRYRYTPGNASSRSRAKNKAARQGRAVKARQHRAGAAGRR